MEGTTRVKCPNMAYKKFIRHKTYKKRDVFLKNVYNARYTIPLPLPVAEFPRKCLIAGGTPIF